MKRTPKTLALVAASALVLTACGNDDTNGEDEENQDPDETPTATVTETETDEPDDESDEDPEEPDDQDEDDGDQDAGADLPDHDGSGQADDADLPGEPTESQFGEPDITVDYVGVGFAEGETVPHHVLPSTSADHLLGEESESMYGGITTGREQLNEDIHWVELFIPEVGHIWQDVELLGFIWPAGFNPGEENPNSWTVTDEFDVDAEHEPEDVASQLSEQILENSEAGTEIVTVNIAEDTEWTFDLVMDGEGPVLGERYTASIVNVEGGFVLDDVTVSTICENPLTADGECQ